MNGRSYTLRVWRQKGPNVKGRLVEYRVSDIAPDMSILETLDMLNDQLTKKGEDPVAFDSDCREGICGTCGLVVEGVAHGPRLATTTCELRMRHFKDGAVITIEPFRAAAFPMCACCRRSAGASPAGRLVKRSARDWLRPLPGSRGSSAGALGVALR